MYELLETTFCLLWPWSRNWPWLFCRCLLQSPHLHLSQASSTVIFSSGMAVDATDPVSPLLQWSSGPAPDVNSDPEPPTYGQTAVPSGTSLSFSTLHGQSLEVGQAIAEVHFAGHRHLVLLCCMEMPSLLRPHVLLHCVPNAPHLEHWADMVHETREPWLEPIKLLMKISKLLLANCVKNTSTNITWNSIECWLVNVTARYRRVHICNNHV